MRFVVGHASGEMLGRRPIEARWDFTINVWPMPSSWPRWPLSKTSLSAQQSNKTAQYTHNLILLWLCNYIESSHLMTLASSNIVTSFYSGFVIYSRTWYFIYRYLFPISSFIAHGFPFCASSVGQSHAREKYFLIRGSFDFFHQIVKGYWKFF